MSSSRSASGAAFSPRSGLVLGLLALVAPQAGSVAEAASATTAEIEPRILAQQGLAVALASTVLQSQFDVLDYTLTKNKLCHAKPDGSSVKLLRRKAVSSTVIESTVDVYYDSACTIPYVHALSTLTSTSAGTGGSFAITETAHYTGLAGAKLGSLTLNETVTITSTTEQLTGLGTFAPVGGAQKVDLGLACTIPVNSTGKTVTFPCQGGFAQDFPKLSLSLASVTPLTLTANLKAPYAVSFVGASADLQTGAPGALGIDTPTGASLGITGAGTAYGSDTTKGKAASFALFPPTPTHWAITDAAHGARVSIAVTSDTTKESSGSVTTTTGGTVLATIAVDQSGTGTITYQDGTVAAVTSWLLAD